MEIFAKFKIFKLWYLGPGKGFRGPLKGYLSKITYISVRPDSFWEFSKFELSRSKFLRKTHFSGAKYGAQNWPSAFWASPNPYLYISGLFFFFGDQKNTPPPLSYCAQLVYGHLLHQIFTKQDRYWFLRILSQINDLNWPENGKLKMT